jgi:ABC-type Na+ transport system ATPase subunit NatA
MGTIITFGGPILYLFVYGFVLLAILVWVHSGSIFPRRLEASRWRPFLSQPEEAQAPQGESRQDVVAEARSVSISDDLLRVLHVTKSFGNNKVVDDVSLGVSRDTIFAMLGPNGAGKTTCFNVIRELSSVIKQLSLIFAFLGGDVVPEAGDALIKGVSVVHHPRAARISLGVCPQFTAIDSQLTVREHLIIYGRLKGLRRDDLRDNVESLMRATTLISFADRLASKLSGGNQRKLSLAIALIGKVYLLGCVLNSTLVM